MNMNELDHIVLAARDLEAAKSAFEAQTGAAPVDGGPHVGLGTRNALVSFGSGRYLEILAPDPAQSLEGTFGEQLAQLTETRLLHWAVRVNDLNAVSRRAKENGFAPGEIRRMARELPGGGRLVWELMSVGGHDHRGFMPFYIDWLDCTHPSETSPLVGPLFAFQLTLPPGSTLVLHLNPAPQDVDIVEGDPTMTLTFESPNGRVTFTETSPMGFPI